MTDPICAKCGHPRSNYPYRHPFVGPSKDDTIAELEATLNDCAAQHQRIEELEAQIKILGDVIHKRGNDIAKLRYDNKRLREATNQCRLAFAGYVSTQSAIDKLDTIQETDK